MLSISFRAFSDASAMASAPATAPLSSTLQLPNCPFIMRQRLFHFCPGQREMKCPKEEEAPPKPQAQPQPQAQAQLQPLPTLLAPGRNLSGVEALRQAVCFWGSDLHLRCSSIGYISRTLCHGSCTIRKASQTFCLPPFPPFATLAFLPTFLLCLTLQRISLTCILKNSFALAIFQFPLLRSCLQNIKKGACRYA